MNSCKFILSYSVLYEVLKKIESYCDTLKNRDILTEIRHRWKVLFRFMFCSIVFWIQISYLFLNELRDSVQDCVRHFISSFHIESWDKLWQLNVPLVLWSWQVISSKLGPVCYSGLQFARNIVLGNWSMSKECFV